MTTPRFDGGLLSRTAVQPGDRFLLTLGDDLTFGYSLYVTSFAERVKLSLDRLPASGVYAVTVPSITGGGAAVRVVVQSSGQTAPQPGITLGDLASRIQDVLVGVTLTALDPATVTSPLTEQDHVAERQAITTLQTPTPVTALAGLVGGAASKVLYVAAAVALVLGLYWIGTRK